MASIRKPLAFVALGFGVTAAIGAAPPDTARLSAEEKAIVKAVDGHVADEIAALQKVIDTDSGTLNVAGVQEVGRYFQAELEKLRFQVRWIAMPEAMKRGGHLVAERLAPNARGKRVLLIGHVDTVFEGKGHRYERSGDKITGAGVSDMKGGDIIIL